MSFRTIALLLFKFLKLHRGEEKKLLMFAGINFIMSITIGMMNSGVDAIVLTFFGNADPIPMLLIFGSILLIISSILYGAYADRFSGTWIFVITLGICSLSFILFSVLFIFLPDQNIQYYALYVFRFTLSTFLVLQFWGICNLFFDIRQGKRLFPHIMFSGSAGYVAGSFITAGLAGLLQRCSVLWVIAFSSLLSILITLPLMRTPLTVSLKRKKSSPFLEIRQGIASVKYNSLLKIFSISTLLFGITSGLILYTYNDIVANLFKETVGLTSFLGVWRGLAELVVYFLQAILIVKVMSISEMGSSFKTGILTRILGFAIILLFFIFSMTASADFSRQLLLALMSPGSVLAFSILPKDIRNKALAFNTGVISSIGVIIGGIILAPLIRPLQFMFGQTGMYIVLTSIIMGLILWRLMLNIRINGEYLRTLSGNMARGKMDLSLIANNIKNIAINKELYVKLIEDFDHLNSSIKLYLLNALQPHLSEEEQGELLLSRFEKEEDVLKYKIIEILGLIQGEHLHTRVDQLLLSNDRQIRIEAMIYKYRKGMEREKIISTIESMISLKNSDINEVAAAMKIVERLQLQRFIPELVSVLEMGNEQVVKQALQTLVFLKATDAIPVLMSKLFDERYSRLFCRTITDIGPMAARHILDYYSRLERENHEERKKLIQVIGNSREYSYIDFLVNELNELIGASGNSKDIIRASSHSWIHYRCSTEEETLIDEIVLALLNYPVESINPDYSTVLIHLLNNAQKTYKATLNKEKVQKEENGKYASLACKLLEEDILLGLKRMMQSLILVSRSSEDQDTLSKATELIHSDNVRLKSQAFELIEAIGDKNITAYILPYIENLSSAELKIRLNKYFPFIRPDTRVMYREWMNPDKSVFNMRWKKILAESILNV